MATTMIVIPKLSSDEEHILQIIDSQDSYWKQLQAINQFMPPKPISQKLLEDFGEDFFKDYINPNITNVLSLLQDQGFILGYDKHIKESIYPISLTAIGRGYLENNSILIALLDQALLKLDLPENKRDELKTSAMNQFKESGQDFLIKLLVEGLARLSGF